MVLRHRYGGISFLVRSPRDTPPSAAPTSILVPLSGVAQPMTSCGSRGGGCTGGQRGGERTVPGPLRSSLTPPPPLTLFFIDQCQCHSSRGRPRTLPSAHAPGTLLLLLLLFLVPFPASLLFIVVTLPPPPYTLTPTQHTPVLCLTLSLGPRLHPAWPCWHCVYMCDPPSVSRDLCPHHSCNVNDLEYFKNPPAPSVTGEQQHATAGRTPTSLKVL